MKNITYQHRVQSVDLLRGIIMLIMALDHVRDFFGPAFVDPSDLKEASIPLFLTRIIAHLCAPGFFLLSGVSAYLYGRKVSKSQLSYYLLTRGAWLIFLEVTVISFAWTFNANHLLVVQVIFALGISMMILAGLIWLSRSSILIIALATICGHNLFDGISFSSTGTNAIWQICHVPTDYYLNNWVIHDFYPIIPWFAVMALGYYLGAWFEYDSAVRRKRFYLLGIFSLFIFVALRTLNIYGDSRPWIHTTHYIYSILYLFNVTKYPPSLHYLFITLGVSFVLLAAFENWRKRGVELILNFGKVPMFFYIIHLYFIHALASLYSILRYHSLGGWWWRKDPWLQHDVHVPYDYHFNITFVYFVWLAIMIALYPLCRWYRQYKATHTYLWLSYL